MAEGGAVVKEKELDHAAKVREARDARRKRILARSSERLAYITGEAKPLSSPLSSSATPSFDSTGPCTAHEPRISFASRSLSFNGSKEACPQVAESCGKSLGDFATLKSCLGEAGKSKESRKVAIEAQPSKDVAIEEAELASSFPDENYRESPSSFIKKLSFSIEGSLLPRVICAACTALVFVGLFTLTSWGHQRPGSLLGFYSPLAIVLAMDFIVLVGAFLFFPKTKEEVKPSLSEAKTSKWSILMQLVLAVSLDCSIFASLLGGGLLISNYPPYNML